VIVRISGLGQYELDDQSMRQLDEIDAALTEVINAGQEQEFHQQLHKAISLVCNSGKPVAPDTVVPSDVILPPDDVTLEEARKFFTDEGLMAPLPA